MARSRFAEEPRVSAELQLAVFVSLRECDGDGVAGGTMTGHRQKGPKDEGAEAESIADSECR